MVFFLKQNITNAYILAGGNSKRMGKDKLFLPINHSTMLQQTIDKCKIYFDSVTIVAKETNKFRDIECEVITDSAKAEGPLAGLITAINHSSNQYCFITAADLIDLNDNIIDALLNNINDEDFIGLSENNLIQPLCGIYSKNALPTLTEKAQSSNNKVSDIIIHLNYKLIDVELKNWRNINSPEDYWNIEENHV